MPRLRYKKSYDFTLYESDDEESAKEGPAISGNSWLSNAAVVANIPDAKIRQSIITLKAQIKVLEAELLSRHFSGQHISGKNWDEIGSKRRRTFEEAESPRSHNRHSKRNDKQFKKIATLKRTLSNLGIKDVNKLIDEWSKIVATAERKSDEA